MPATSASASTMPSTRPVVRSKGLLISVPHPRGAELTGRDAEQVGGVGVEPGPGADDVAQDRDVGTQRVQGRLELLLLRVQQRQQLVDLTERRADLRLVVRRDGAELV